MSVFSSMRYCLGEPNDFSNLWAALAFMPFGLFFDFMDGKVARWRKKASMMGQELDSLADLVRVKDPLFLAAADAEFRSRSALRPPAAPWLLAFARPWTTCS